MLRAATALVLLALPAAAPIARAQESLTPDAFLDRAQGRTLTFVDGPSGALVGIEQFFGRDRSVYARADGSCAYGRVTVEGAELCFRYDDDAGRVHCWWPFEADGQLHVRIASTVSDEVQRVETITDTPVDCRPVPNV